MLKGQRMVAAIRSGWPLHRMRCRPQCPRTVVDAAAPLVLDGGRLVDLVREEWAVGGIPDGRFKGAQEAASRPVARECECRWSSVFHAELCDEPFCAAVADERVERGRSKHVHDE